MAAGLQAWRDAALQVTPQNAERIGVNFGSGIGGLPLIESMHDELKASGPRRISPFFIPGSIINMTPACCRSRSARRARTCHGDRVHHFDALHRRGGKSIRYGDADVMIAGGSEAAVTELAIGGFASARALSTRNDDPGGASRPWDKDRDGFVLGEGAGAVVLEEYEHAKARGAKIYCELVGYGVSADAHHMTAPPEDGDGGYRAMRNALKDAPGELSIDYINAHGTSTPLGDVAETLAIKRLLGARAGSVAVNSTKSMTGHLLGAAGAVEAVFSILAIRDQVSPPTINLRTPIRSATSTTCRTSAPMPIRVALSNSFGFGGTNGTLIFKQLEEPQPAAGAGAVRALGGRADRRACRGGAVPRAGPSSGRGHRRRGAVVLAGAGSARKRALLRGRAAVRALEVGGDTLESGWRAARASRRARERRYVSAALVALCLAAPRARTILVTADMLGGRCSGACGSGRCGEIAVVAAKQLPPSERPSRVELFQTACVCGSIDVAERTLSPGVGSPAVRPGAIRV
jgi:3-oxoacyl-[acyl-carrier-protein] synthase II